MKKVHKRARRAFTEEFKRETVRAFHARGDQQIKDFCRQVDVGDTIVRRWVEEYGAEEQGKAPPAEMPAAPSVPTTEVDSGFLEGGLAERMRTLVGIDPENPPEPMSRGRKPKKQSEQLTLLGSSNPAPRQVPVTYAPEPSSAEPDLRMQEYLRRTTAKALKERDALAMVLGLFMREPESFGCGGGPER